VTKFAGRKQANLKVPNYEYPIGRMWPVNTNILPYNMSTEFISGSQVFHVKSKQGPVSQNPTTSPQSLQHQTSSPTEKLLSMIGNEQNSRTER